VRAALNMVRPAWTGRRGTALRAVAGGSALALVISLLAAPPAVAAPRRYQPPPLPKMRSVPGRVIAPLKQGPNPAARRALHGAPADAAFPAAGAATVELPTAGAEPAGAGVRQAKDAVAAAPGGVTARVGGLVVRVAAPARPSGRAASAAAATSAPPSRVRIEVLGRDQAARAGLRGVLLRVTRADGGTAAAPVVLSVDYAPFRNAFGADWASRLELATIFGCAVSAPATRGCRLAPLRATNDVATGVLTAQVQAAPVAAGQAGPVARAGQAVGSAAAGLVAATSGTSGPAGDYSATSLTSSATWAETGSTGSFTWSYPMAVPPAAGGLEPRLELSYSSQSVDGLTAASNNQPSWIGQGFDMWPGFIERRYKACADDMGGTANNTTVTGDLCWGTDNATMSLGGKAVELIRDDATGAWHSRIDDGSRIDFLTGAPNGANNGEYWRVTTPDGTQYWFGLNHLPGWAAGDPVTNSTWTVPVFGNNPGEPCHQATFDASWCQQAWRWNLDYVVDPHGNSMSYWYTPETNNYGRDANPAEVSSYIRGGTLDHINYGTRTGSDFSGNAPERVLFTVADRCTPGSVCDSAHPASWPDVPWDQSCTGSPCTNVLTPTFWTTKRLAAVTTQLWDTSANAYRNVDSWALTHSYPDPGDGTRAGLWLASVTRTGQDGGSAPLPSVTFTGIQLTNRVNVTSLAPAMNWWRVAAINTETGGIVSVGYSPPDCVTGSRMPSAPDSNTLRCFPAFWTPQGATAPVLDWFQKYVVTAVAETDLTGGSPRVITTYNYMGNPAWHYSDDDGLVPASRKTWGQWRGYQQVQVFHGDPGEQTQTDTLYFTGMDGDHLSSGGTRSVILTDSRGGRVADSDALAGMAREVIVHDGPGGPAVTDTINDPYQSAPTSARTIAGVTVDARHTGTAATTVYTALDGGRGWRTTRTENTFDGYGMVTAVNDLGDTSTPADEMCTRYTYARNTSLWLMNYVSQAETDALSCDKTPASAADVISVTHTSYDGQAYGTAPTVGDVTKTEQMSAWPSTFITASQAAYDAYGRVTDKWDALGAHTSIAYTPATGGPATQTVTTNPLGHASTTTLDPARELPVTTVDANGKVTSLAYDPLGRLTGVWLPGRPIASATPNTSYAYLVRTNGAVAVTTSRLDPDGTYVTSYQLFDGLLRPRQTQAPAPGGGRIITDTFYDTAGRAVKTFGAYYNSSSPSTDLFTATDFTQVPEQYATVYDGAGRVTASIYQPGGQEQWRTTTAYGGDHSNVTPPAGGTATSTYIDARGRTVQLRQYQGGSPTGAYDATTYAYNPKGQLASVTDQAGNSWSYGYDFLGRRSRITDPDQGTSTATYDNAGQLTTTTDSRGQTLAYAYDALGRKTGLYSGSTTGTQLAGWVYDTLAKGQLTSATRYVNGNAYTIAARGYNNYYEPAGTTITIPAAEGKLAGSYAFRSTYLPDGTQASTSYPATGDLAAETVRYGYTSDLGLPATLTTSLAADGQPDTTGTASYITETDYSVIGQLQRYTMNDGGSSVWQTYLYQTGTGRLAQSYVAREAVTPNEPTDFSYTYDPAGNITKIADTPGGGAAVPADTQCFGYDYLRRLTQAWTPGSGDCTTALSASGLGGPAPYWQSWTYDSSGNRLSETDHATAQGDVTASYTYPAPGSPQPHAVQSATVTAAGGTTTQQYKYDSFGDTTSRPGPAGTQTLAWSPQGDLSSITDPSGSTSYIYDADGNQLIRHDATGATLYLPGTELRLSSATGALTATRYYTHAGHTVAMRTAAGVSWLLTDPENTTSLVINAATQSALQQRQTPFGQPRGASVTLPTDKGFVGGTTQPTGLVLLGARQYDPATGRFISVDPLIDLNNPPTMQGYSYAGNTPITQSDPTGRYAVCGDPTGDCGGRTSGATQAPTQPVSAPPTPTPVGPSGGGRTGSGDHGSLLDRIRQGFRSAVDDIFKSPKILINVRPPEPALPEPDLPLPTGGIVITDVGGPLTGGQGPVSTDIGGRQPGNGPPPGVIPGLVAHTSDSNDDPQNPVLPDPKVDPEATAEALGIPPGETSSEEGGANPAPNQPPADHGSHAGTGGDAHQGTQAQDGVTSQGTSQQPVTTTTVPQPGPGPFEAPQPSPYEPNLEGIAIVVVGGLAILVTKITRAIRGS
jgi:RHS repeat-associated protein